MQYKAYYSFIVHNLVQKAHLNKILAKYQLIKTKKNTGKIDQVENELEQSMQRLSGKKMPRVFSWSAMVA